MIIILLFIFISISITSDVNEKLGKIIFDEYNRYNTYLTFISVKDNKFSKQTFLSEIEKRIKLSKKGNLDIDIGYYKFPKDLDNHYIINKNEIEKNYFVEDKYPFKTDNYEIMFLNKKKRFYGSMIELIIIFISLPSLVVIIFVLNFIIKNNFYKPLQYINDSIDRVVDTGFSEKIEVKFEEDLLNTLISKINNIIKKFKQKNKE